MHGVARSPTVVVDLRDLSGGACRPPRSVCEMSTASVGRDVCVSGKLTAPGEPRVGVARSATRREPRAACLCDHHGTPLRRAAANNRIPSQNAHSPPTLRLAPLSRSLAGRRQPRRVPDRRHPDENEPRQPHGPARLLPPARPHLRGRRHAPCAAPSQRDDSHAARPTPQPHPQVPPPLRPRRHRPGPPAPAASIKGENTKLRHRSGGTHPQRDRAARRSHSRCPPPRRSQRDPRPRHLTRLLPLHHPAILPDQGAPRHRPPTNSAASFRQTSRSESVMSTAIASPTTSAGPSTATAATSSFCSSDLLCPMSSSQAISQS